MSKLRLAAWAMTLLASLGVSGCAVRMNQLESAKRIAPSLRAAFSDEGARAVEYAWEFSFNGAAFIVYPVEVQGRNVIFRNASELRLVWDGESLIVIENMPGSFGRYEQGVEGAKRWYARANMPVLYLDCTPRRDWRLRENQKGWRQECTGELEGRRVRAEHSVEFDQNDAIREIRSTLAPTVSPASLRRLSP